MKSRTKQAFAILLVIVFVFMSMSVSSYASGTKLSLSSASGKPGDTVMLNVDLSGNTGIAYLKIKVAFDKNVVSLQNAQNTGIIEGNFVKSKTTDVNPYILSWTNPEDSTGNGTIATLSFKINSSTEDGEYDVSVVVAECYNQDFNDVNIYPSNGCIKVDHGCSHNNIVEVKGTAPTCTQVGLTAGFRCSDCGAWITPQEEIPALGHEYTGQIIPPSCTRKGYTKYSCIRCEDEYFDDFTNAIPHNFSILQADDEYHWFECSYNCGTITGKEVHYGGLATCSEQAHCSECGTPYGEKAAHTLGEWVIVVPATYDSEGLEARMCSVCGEVLETRPVEKIVYPTISIIDEENSTVCIDDEHKIIYGFSSGLLDEEDIHNYICSSDENATIEIVPTANGCGTGTLVNLVKNGEVIESYTIIIFGDATGDGIIDESDFVMIDLYNAMLYFPEEDSPEFLGMDCNRDGVVDESDIVLVDLTNAFMGEIDQVNGGIIFY